MNETDEISFTADIKHLRNVTIAMSELKKESKSPGKSSGDKKARNLTLECYSDFIRIKDVDPSNVLGLSFDLDDELVSDYTNNLKDDEAVKIVVDLDKLIEAISEIEGSVNFEIDIKSKRLLVWSSYYEYKLSFKVDKTEVKLPSVANKSFVDLEGEQLYTILKKCSSIHKYIIITTEGAEKEEDFILTFVSKEQGTNNSIEVKLDEFNVLDSEGIKENTKIKIDTGATSLIDVLKATIKSAKVVKLLLENERPIIMTYQMIEGHGDTKIIVAPRALDA